MNYKYYGETINEEISEDRIHVAFKTEDEKVISFERNIYSEDIHSLVIWKNEEEYRENMGE